MELVMRERKGGRKGNIKAVWMTLSPLRHDNDYWTYREKRVQVQFGQFFFRLVK
jgi:hypothetical protein